MPAVLVLYFTASEKENLRTESYLLFEQCTGKQNYVIKSEETLTTSTWATEKWSK